MFVRILAAVLALPWIGGCARFKPGEQAPPLQLLSAQSLDSAVLDLDMGSDGYMWLALGTGGSAIYSVRVPTEPVRLSRLKPEDATVRVRRFDNQGFAIERSASLRRFNLSDLTVPEEAARFGLRQIHDVARDVANLQVDGTTYLVVGSQFRGLSAYTEREEQLVPVHLTGLSGLGLVNQLEYHEGVLYLSDYNHGLHLVDPTGWPRLSQVSHFPLKSGLDSLLIHQGVIWLTTVEDGVLALERKDDSLRVAGRIEVSGRVTALACTNNLLVLSRHSLSKGSSVDLYDITDAEDPQLVQSLAFDDNVTALAAMESAVYVFTESGEMRIFSLNRNTR